MQKQADSMEQAVPFAWTSLEAAKRTIRQITDEMPKFREKVKNFCLSARNGQRIGTTSWGNSVKSCWKPLPPAACACWK